MSLTDMWRNVRDKMGGHKSAPASELLPRMREQSGAYKALASNQPSVREVTPFANEQLLEQATPIPPPDWATIFPGHVKALVADLAKRGESIGNWEIQDGRDQGVSESGHTVSFVLHKIGTSATIQVELTMFKGQLSKVRVS